MDEHPSPHAAAASASDIYLLAAHPDWRASRVTQRALEAVGEVPRVSVCDLYERYPDYAIDVAAEQAHLAAARLVVLLHPIQWYSMPALQKLWMDDVLRHGWAYGDHGTALRGKDLWLVASTGGTSDSYHPQGYNRYFFDAFLPAYEQTAALCGMRFLPPLILHGAHRASQAAVEAHAQMLQSRLQSYPQWPELEDMQDCIACDVPVHDRLSA